MKRLLILVTCLVFQGISAQENDVRKTMDAFFEGFHLKDTIKMKSVFAKEIVFHSIAESSKGNVFSVENVNDFAKSIASIPNDMQFEEKLLSYKIQVDGSMAHAWAPYEFYVNGKLSHSGVNSFQLFNVDGVWKIVYCIDTRRK